MGTVVLGAANLEHSPWSCWYSSYLLHRHLPNLRQSLSLRLMLMLLLMHGMAIMGIHIGTGTTGMEDTMDIPTTGDGGRGMPRPNLKQKLPLMLRLTPMLSFMATMEDTMDTHMD